MSEKEPYVVEPDGRDACPHCNAGTMWDVVFQPNDTAISTTYERQEDAEDMAADLNGAYNLGYEDVAAPDLLAALEALRSFMWSEGYADQTAAMAQADAAIVKAGGSR